MRNSALDSSDIPLSYSIVTLAQHIIIILISILFEHINIFIHLQNTEEGPGRGRDGAARIATHYRFSLTKAFATGHDAPFSGKNWPIAPPCAIIVEDDLLFSPDFLGT